MAQRKIQSLWKTTPQELLLDMGFVSMLAFGRTKRQDTPHIELFKYAQNAITATVAQDGADPVLRTYATGANQTVTMPTTSDKLKVNTAEIYLEPEYSELPANVRDGIRLIEAENRKKKILARANRRLLETHAINAIFGHGVLKYTPSGGAEITIDYGLLAELHFDVGAADAAYYWGGASADPVADVQAAIDAMIDAGGVPSAIVGRPELIEEFIKEAETGNRYDSKNMDYGTLKPEQMKEFAGTKAGSFAGVQIYKYSGVVPGVGKLVPADTIAIIGETEDNAKHVGRNEETFPTNAEGIKVVASKDGMLFAGYSNELSRYIAASLTALPVIGDVASVSTIKVKA